MNADLKAGLLVYVRIALYVAAGRLAAGGWLPQEMVPEFTSPIVVEMIAGGIVAVGTVVWYRFSAARDALVRRFR